MGLKQVLIQHSLRLGRLKGPPTSFPNMKGPKQVLPTLYPSLEKFKSQNAEMIASKLTRDHQGQQRLFNQVKD